MNHIKWGRMIIAGLIANFASFIVGGGGYVTFGRRFFSDPDTTIWR